MLEQVCLTGSFGGECDSQSWGCKFKLQVGCRGYLKKKSLKKKQLLQK